MANVAEEVREPSGLRGLVDRHLGLVVSAIVILAFSIRLVVVAHGNLETVLALIEASDPGAVLVPLIATTAATGLAWVLAFAVPNILCDPRLRPGWAEPIVPRVAVWVLALVPAFFLLPAFIAIVYIVMTAFWIWAGPGEARAWEEVRRRAADGDEKAQRSLRRRSRFQVSPTMYWLLIIGFIVGGALLVDDRPWLPSERISTHSATIVGYVLSDSGDELAILTDDTRTVKRVTRTATTTRVLCTIDRSSRTLAQVTLWDTSTPKYPKCEKR